MVKEGEKVQLDTDQRSLMQTEHKSDIFIEISQSTSKSRRETKSKQNTKKRKNNIVKVGTKVQTRLTSSNKTSKLHVKFKSDNYCRYMIRNRIHRKQRKVPFGNITNTSENKDANDSVEKVSVDKTGLIKPLFLADTGVDSLTSRKDEEPLEPKIDITTRDGSVDANNLSDVKDSDNSLDADVQVFIEVKDTDVGPSNAPLVSGVALPTANKQLIPEENLPKAGIVEKLLSTPLKTDYTKPSNKSVKKKKKWERFGFCQVTHLNLIQTIDKLVF